MEVVRNMKIKNNAGENPYLYSCPWCDAPKGCLCKDEHGIEYTDGSYHRARLMKDCLEGNDESNNLY